MEAWILIALGLAILLLAYVGISYIFAQLTLNPKRQPIEAVPSDYGMAYEDIEFKSTDGLNLRGWFIPGSPRKVLLVTHPLFCNRHGFLVRNKSPFMATKTDIDLLLVLKALHDAGYSILTFDFRNHGASDRGRTGVGLTEYQDVLGALEYMQKRADVSQADLGLVGFCMGANSMIVALSRGSRQFLKARCFVAVQPISMAVFVRSYIRSNFTPLGFILLPMINLIRRILEGYPLADMTPKAYVKDTSIPTLYVQGKIDPWTDLTDIQGLYAATPAPKDFWLLETDCRPEAYQYVAEHPQRMIEFVNAHMRAEGDRALENTTDPEALPEFPTLA